MSKTIYAFAAAFSAFNLYLYLAYALPPHTVNSMSELVQDQNKSLPLSIANSKTRLLPIVVYCQAASGWALTIAVLWSMLSSTLTFFNDQFFWSSSAMLRRVEADGLGNVVGLDDRMLIAQKRLREHTLDLSADLDAKTRGKFQMAQDLLSNARELQFIQSGPGRDDQSKIIQGYCAGSFSIYVSVLRNLWGKTDLPEAEEALRRVLAEQTSRLDPDKPCGRLTFLYANEDYLSTFQHEMPDKLQPSPTDNVATIHPLRRPANAIKNFLLWTRQ